MSDNGDDVLSEEELDGGDAVFEAMMDGSDPAFADTPLYTQATETPSLVYRCDKGHRQEGDFALEARGPDGKLRTTGPICCECVFDDVDFIGERYRNKAVAS
jgi:hypothetical protein